VAIFILIPGLQRSPCRLSYAKAEKNKQKKKIGTTKVQRPVNYFLSENSFLLPHKRQQGLL
jgi:hypothetical protein